MVTAQPVRPEHQRDQAPRHIDRCQRVTALIQQAQAGTR